MGKPKMPVRTDEPAAVWVDRHALHAWDKNPRKNDGEPVKRVMESIKRFGFASPIIARTNGEVIAGHTRLKAAEALGLDRVPVRYMDLDPAEAHLLALADNKLNEEAEWDAAAVASILSDYSLDDAALAGWDSDDLEKLADELGANAPKEVTEDEVPEPPVDPVTKPGDLWILGEHRLLCGDSTKAEDVERLMAGAKARYGMFDPPYGIAVIGGVSKAKGSIGGVSKAKANEYEPIHGDDKPFDPTPFLGLAEECVWWGANYFADKLPCKKGWIVWDKKGREWNDDFSDCEMAWTPFKTVARIYRHVWMGLVQEGERELRQHPTQKPVAMFAKLMREMFTDDGVVLDLWLGSGTTLIAAEQLGRRCYGIEISPVYCDVIVKRWETLTGKKAELAS